MLNVVVIGYVWPEPNSSAAGQNMQSIIERCLAANFNVTFLTAATDSEHKADLEATGVSVKPIALNCSSFNTLLAQILPDVVIFDRYMTEEQFSWRVKEVCPNALRILNTEDLHSLRQARHDAVKQHGDARLRRAGGRKGLQGRHLLGQQLQDDQRHVALRRLRALGLWPLHAEIRVQNRI